MNTKKDKPRKIAIFTSIEPEYVEAIDIMAKERGWSRPLTIRHFLKVLIDSLKNSGHIESPWYTLDDLQINPVFGEFEKKKK